MTVNNNVKWIHISYSAPSLLSVIQNDTYQQLNMGRASWTSLMSSPNLQENCNKEGFNVKTGDVMVRLGIISNNELGCLSPDSWLGFGSELTLERVCGRERSTSCGNENLCQNSHTKAFGIILVK